MSSGRAVDSSRCVFPEMTARVTKFRLQPNKPEHRCWKHTTRTSNSKKREYSTLFPDNLDVGKLLRNLIKKRIITEPVLYALRTRGP